MCLSPPVVLPWLRAPLPPSRRRQTICVVQIGGADAGDDAGDRRHRRARCSRRSRWPHSATLSWSIPCGCGTALAEALRSPSRILDASLAFQNIWPTPAIRWEGELSIEFALRPLLIAADRRWLGPPSRACGRARWPSCGSCWRSATTRTSRHRHLYGREINLYWDMRYMPDVAAMVGRCRADLAGGCSALAVAAIVCSSLLYRLFRWALRWCPRRRQRPRSNARDARRVQASSSRCSRAQRLLESDLRSPACFCDAGDGDLRAPGSLCRGGAGAARSRCRPARHGLRPVAGQKRGRVSRSSSSRTARSRSSAGHRAWSRAGRARRSTRRFVTPAASGLGVCRVADLRRLVLAGAHQPDVRRRGSRSRDECAADDGKPRRRWSPNSPRTAIRRWR